MISFWIRRRSIGRGSARTGTASANLRLAGPQLVTEWAALVGANLGAYLVGAVLTDADLTQAHLAGANLTDTTLNREALVGADLTGAFMLSDAGVPEGWQRDTDSGRLKRADISSGGTTTN